ncbi:MAG: hypothetical protein ACI4WS_04390 [Oscillospiraceae bacterium]
MPDNNANKPENSEKQPQQYRSILSEDDGTTPRPIPRKKKDPMAQVRREIEEQQRQQREKAELLKLRQGLVDESEELAEHEPQYEKPTGWKAVENFLYHYKIQLIIGIFAVAILTFMIVQTATRESKDLYVLAISTSGSSGIYAKTNDIETALERYCPDFDGNGYVHVGVNFIDLYTDGGYSEYTDANNYKFSAELFSGDSQLYLTDTGIIALINEVATTGTAEAETEEADPDQVILFFAEKADDHPDAQFYKDCGLQLNTTGFTEQARWKSCPDEVGLYLRAEFHNMTGNDEDAVEQRRRAKIVYENIINDNVVNPDWNGR